MEKDSLLKLGLSEKEAELYLLLVRMGPSAATTLSRLSKIKRTSIYDILHSLERQGLITQFTQQGLTYFVVDDVKKLHQVQAERASLAHQLVEKLKQQQSGQGGIQVQYYKGQAGYMEMYDDILSARPDELRGWMDLDNFYSVLDPDYEENWTQQRIASGIAVRLIIQESPLTRNFKAKDPASNRHTILLPKEAYPFNTTCFLYDDHITYFDPAGEITGIRIHSPNLAKLQNQLFEMTWQLWV